MITVVEPATVAEILCSGNFPLIAAEYAAESAIDGLPPPAARFETYRLLEQAGILHIFGARRDGQLIGLLTLLVHEMPHYGRALAISESFFVLKAERKSGAGLKLLRAAEAKARALGCPGVLVSAPFEGDLFKVLPRVGYRETNRIFFKRLANA